MVWLSCVFHVIEVITALEDQERTQQLLKPKNKDCFLPQKHWFALIAAIPLNAMTIVITTNH